MRAIRSMANLDGTVRNKYVDIKKYTEYYHHLKCSTFDVVMVMWEGEEISIYVDDEGLMKDNVARRVVGYPDPLAGHFVICGGVDRGGSTLPLPDKFTISNLEEFVSSINYVIGA